MGKKRWRMAVRALLVWMIAALLSGCIVKLDPEIKGQEQLISEKQIQEERSEAEVPAIDQTEAPETEAPAAEQTDISETTEAVIEQLDEHGFYTDKAQVALYIHIYGHLPDNYITKKEAENLGWDSGKGNMEEVAPGKSIGGSRFGNREELLPKKDGRSYYECDIDYDGGYRGAKRIVYSNDGLIYYTEDHYKTFELLYTSEGKAE